MLDYTYKFGHNLIVIAHKGQLLTLTLYFHHGILGYDHQLLLYCDLYTPTCFSTFYCMIGHYSNSYFCVLVLFKNFNQK